MAIRGRTLWCDLHDSQRDDESDSQVGIHGDYWNLKENIFINQNPFYERINKHFYENPFYEQTNQKFKNDTKMLAWFIMKKKSSTLLTSFKQTCELLLS